MDVLLAGDQDPKKRMRKRGEGIGEFQIQGRLTELMSQVVLKMQWLNTAVWELGFLDTKTNFRLKLESRQDSLSFSLTPDLAFRNGFRDDMDYQDKGKMSRDADGLADLKKEQDRLLKNLIRQQMICIPDVC